MSVMAAASPAFSTSSPIAISPRATCSQALRPGARGWIASTSASSFAAQISASCTSRTSFARGSGAFLHGHTYIGHPLACAAALAVQRVIKRDRLLDNVKARGAELARRLKERFGNHPHVGDIRGRGLFQAIELVADRSGKTPFDPAHALHARVKAEAMSRGLMVYPSGGTANGIAGDHVLIAPPFIIEAPVIDIIVDRLGDAVDAAVSTLP